MTKEERAEYMKRYREEHREQTNANQRYYRNQNKERTRELARNYYHRHKDDPEFMRRRREAVNRWMDKNRDEWNARQREYQRKKRERKRA